MSTIEAVHRAGGDPLAVSDARALNSSAPSATGKGRGPVIASTRRRSSSSDTSQATRRRTLASDPPTPDMTMTLIIKEIDMSLVDQHGWAFVRAVAVAHEWMAIATLHWVQVAGFDGVTPTMFAAMLRIEETGTAMEALRAGWGGSVVSEQRGGGQISRQAVTQSIALLAGQGYVSLAPVAGDRRRRLVIPTERGLLLRRACSDSMDRLSGIVEGLLGDDTCAFTGTLRHLSETLMDPDALQMRS